MTDSYLPEVDDPPGHLSGKPTIQTSALRSMLVEHIGDYALVDASRKLRKRKAWFSHTVSAAKACYRA
jgi:hypothetical protein